MAGKRVLVKNLDLKGHVLDVKKIFFILVVGIFTVFSAVPVDSPDSLPPLEKLPELKEFIQAQYPADDLKKGVEGSVFLELIVSDSGNVDSVRVIKGLDPGLDSAAVRAARQFVFSPATAAGKAVAVALEYEYRFFITDKVVALDEFINLQGTLQEKGTRKPLADALVVLSFKDTAADSSLKVPWRWYLEKIGHFSGQRLEGGKLVTTTDSLGRFVFKSLPSGPVLLSFPVAGYALDSVTELMEPGKLLAMEYRLEPRGNDNEIVVYGKVEKKEVAKQSLSLTEIRRIPGFGGDAVKAIQALPGVARASFISGDVIVRGSGNSDTKYYLDGVRIPLLFHFGGLKSTYNSDALSSIDLYPGGFNTRYGNCVGGVVEIKGRQAKTDRWHGDIDVNMLDASFSAEGPVSSKLSLLVTARRSYIANVASFVLDLLHISVPLTVVPYYWDVVSRIDYAQSPSKHMFLTAFASTDAFDFITQARRGGGSTDAAGARDQLSLNMGFKKLLYGYDASFSDALRNELRASIDQTKQLLTSRMNFLDYSFSLRDELTWKPFPFLTMRTGLDGFVDSAADQFSVSDRQNAAVSVNENLYVNGGVYENAEYSPLENLFLTPGVRYDYYSDLHKGEGSLRMTARYNYRKGHTIKGAVGTYNQKPQPAYTTAPTLGNPGLPPTLGRQAVIGYEYDITDLVNLDVQAYYNTQSRIPRPTDSITPAGAPLNYIGDEKGRMYGLEIMIRHQLGKHFFGWIAYTLSRSERQSPVAPPDPQLVGVSDILPFTAPGVNSNFRGVWDPGVWFPFDKDQTHNLQLVASWKLPRRWDAGCRLRYVTGNPITPQLGYTKGQFEFDAARGRYRDIEGDLRSDRMGWFFQVDARVDKQWLYNSWTFSVYLDIQNLNYFWYNSPEIYAYNYDGSQRQAIGGIILPSLGVRAEF
jgi:TonB family protein